PTASLSPRRPYGERRSVASREFFLRNGLRHRPPTRRLTPQRHDNRENRRLNAAWAPHAISAPELRRALGARAAERRRWGAQQPALGRRLPPTAIAVRSSVLATGARGSTPRPGSSPACSPIARGSDRPPGRPSAG